MMARRAERETHRLKRHYFAREATKLARMEATVCGNVALNLTVSELDAVRLADNCPSAKIQVVSNGVDTEYFRPSGTSAPRVGSLVFAGGLTWYPNLEAMRFFLREIWPLLVADNPDRSMVIIGRDPPTDLRATGDDRVRTPGFVEDVRPWIDEAAIYVCPIRDGGGTRLKILDALAMSKPLVATGLSVEGLDLTEEVHYLRAENPLEFLEQIRRLDHNPQLARSLGNAGRQFVEGRYSWPQVGLALATAYETARYNGGSISRRETRR